MGGDVGMVVGISGALPLPGQCHQRCSACRSDSPGHSDAIPGMNHTHEQSRNGDRFRIPTDLICSEGASIRWTPLLPRYSRYGGDTWG